MALAKSEDRLLQKSVFIREPAINGARSESGVMCDTRDRGALEPALSQNFQRRFEQLAQRFAAPRLLWLQPFGLFRGHPHYLYQHQPLAAPKSMP